MRGVHRPVAGVLTLVYLVVLVRTAWITDDAYVSLRTLDHCIQGHGLRWNVDERVQAYTHPLWTLLLLLVCSLTRELYLTTIVVAILCSTLAFVLVVFRLATSTLVCVITGSILILAPAFVSYGTSGLENPLAFLLVALFAIVILQRAPGTGRSFLLGLLGSLLVVTRYDLVFLILPALLYDLYASKRFANTRRMALGFVPALVWFGFSLVYYGSVLPNSAYAKLATGVGRSAYVERGFWYLQDALWRETLLAVVLGAVLVLGLVSRRTALRMLAIGLLAMLGYVVWVGGDFMRGRLLTVPFFLAVCVLAHTKGFGAPTRVLGVVLGVVVVLGWTAPTPTLRSGRDFGTAPGQERRWHGISDERAFYFPTLGLWNGKPLGEKPGHDMERLRARQALDLGRIQLVFAAGVDGLRAGPRAHVVDTWALGDALLSRLPSQGRFRIGHMTRVPPSGYLMTLWTGENRIRDPRIRRYYEDVRRVTRDPLWARARWSSIWALQTGRHGDLVRDHTDYEPMGPRDYVEVADAGPGSAGPQILARAARHHLETSDFEAARSLAARLHEMPVQEARKLAREIEGRLPYASHDSTPSAIPLPERE